ncbi:MFS transporter [Paenibacillus sp. TRM 82003]|nr:MFS transporter [Paenibacillus sp. TRM 82003]
MNDRQAVIRVALGTAVCLMGNAVMYILLPIYWQQFGLDSLWQAGVLLAANRFVRLPAAPFLSMLYRRLPHRGLLAAAAVLAALTTFSYGWLYGFWPLLAMRALWGIAYGMLRLGGQVTVLRASTPANRGYLIGTYNGLWGIGHLAGTLLGGLAADLFGIQATTFGFALIAALAVPLLMKRLPSESDGPGTAGLPAPGSSSAPATALLSLASRGTLRMLSAGFLVAFVYFGVFTSTLAQLVAAQPFRTLSVAGFLIGTAAITGLLQSSRNAWDPFLAPLIGKISDGRGGRVPALRVCTSIGALLMIVCLLPLAPIAWVAVILLVQLTSTFCTTLMDAYAADHAAAAARHVELMNRYSIAVDVGAATGPLLAFALLDWIGLGPLYVGTAVILGFVTFLIGRPLKVTP